MKILHTVKKYHPSAGGMYEVVKQLSEKMVSLGHDVTVATTKLPKEYKPNLKGVKIKEFDIKGNFVSKMTGEIKEYQNFLIKSDFQIISCFAAQQIMCDAMLPILNEIKAKKVFIPTGFSAFYIPEYKEYFQKMGNWMKKFDMNVFLSNDYRDINLARENNIKNTRLIPNGASKQEFGKKIDINIRKKLEISDKNFFILHVGSHTKQKGHKEAIKIFQKAKIKNANFLIIGNKGGCSHYCQRQSKKLNQSKKFKKQNKKIIIKHLNRQQTVAAYKEADIFLFPSNIECSPVVLFECMATGLPFLTTEAGNAKEIVKWSKGGILLPTKKNISLDNFFVSKIKKIIKKIIKRVDNDYQFCKADIKQSAQILEKLYYNQEKRKKLGKSGYQAWLKNFTWEKISKDYEDLYKELLKK
jgi:glycosyltransferase involved in cell wall biosynthesis